MDATRLRVFGRTDWEAWLDGLARSRFGLSGEEFVASYKAGLLQKSGLADDMASVIPLIESLRSRDSESIPSGSLS